jgi:hypothetical protein
MECRPAGPADAARIAELLGQLGYPTTAETVTQRLARLDACGADATWVAEIDGEERRKDAHEFYRRLGLVETGKRFAKPLD